MAKKEVQHERPVQKREDEEELESEGPAGKRTHRKQAASKREGKSPNRRNDFKQAKQEGLLKPKAKPSLGYQGKCVFNPGGAPRHGKQLR